MYILPAGYLELTAASNSSQVYSYARVVSSMLSLFISFTQSQANEHPVLFIFIILLLLPLSYFVTNEFVRRKARISGFDGPPGTPVFGNIPDIKYNAAEKVVASCIVNALTDR
jgi:ABC-type multidrug transport system permease subunit